MALLASSTSLIGASSNDDIDQRSIAKSDVNIEPRAQPTGADHAMMLKKCACFGKVKCRKQRRYMRTCNGPCVTVIVENIIPLLLIMYHIFRMALAIYQYSVISEICWPFQLNILLGKMSTLSIYLFGLYTIRKSKLFGIIRSSFKPLTALKCTVLVAGVSIPYITGLVKAYVTDYTGHTLTFFVFNFTMEISDVLRYWPSTAVVMLLYGCMDTFDMDSIYDLRNRNRDASHDHANDINCEYDNYDHRRFEIIYFEQLDHVSFMKSFERATRKYRIVLASYHAFVVVFFIDVLLLWLSILISMIDDYLGADCVYKSVEYIHYFTETMFYCLLWASIIYKLHVCHGQIERYKNDFAIKVAVDGKQNATQKLLIHQFLQAVIDKRSPFAFYGITPDTKTIAIVITSVLLPIASQTLHFMFKYDPI